MSWKVHKTSWSPRKPKHKIVPPMGPPHMATRAHAPKDGPSRDEVILPKGGITAIMPAPGPRPKFCSYCGEGLTAPPEREG